MSHQVVWCGSNSSYKITENLMHMCSRKFFRFQCLTLLPTGGAFLSHTTIVLAATLKPLKVWLPHFVPSCFYLFATISENFSKVDWPGGLLQSFFKREVFLSKMAEIRREYNFRSEKSFSII